MINNFSELIEQAKNTKPRRLVVAGIQNDAVVKAAQHAAEDHMIIPVLVDQPPGIDRISELFDNAKVIHVEGGEQEIAATAVSAIRAGEGDILLKGSVNTASLMSAVLDREQGIREAQLLSDCFLFESENRKGNQLIAITDGGVVLYPDVDQKQVLIENAVNVYHGLGQANPKVAVCAAIERVNEKMPPTIDAGELKQRWEAGQITGCIVDGPLALDVALSEEAVRIKGLDSPVNGAADILIMPTIEAANLVAKSTQYIAGKEAAHIIMGATVPVLIPSRSDTPRGKYLSIALAVVVGG